MNKELIKKYKVEFDYWLNGGNLLSKHPEEKGWYTVTTVLWNNPSMQYIINDEYVEFRKAIAEGKTIEKCLSKNFHPDDWQYFDPRCLFNEPIDSYRIKPENNLKVNDYVRNKDKQLCEIFYIDKEEGLYDVYNHKTQCRQSYKFSSVEPWVPEAGDLCWFSDSLYKEPTFSRFRSICYTDKTKSEVSWYYAEHTDNNGKNYYKHCQPFIGQLPTGFKDGN